jgi:hypothetical protein
MFGCLEDFGITERAIPRRVFGARAIFLLLFALLKILTMQRIFYFIIIASALHYRMCADNYFFAASRSHLGVRSRPLASINQTPPSPWCDTLCRHHRVVSSSN